MAKLFKKFFIFGLFLLLCSCGGGGGGTSGSAPAGGGSGGAAGGGTATANAADNVTKVQVSNFLVEDNCNVSFNTYSTDSKGNAVKDAEIQLTVTQGNKSYTTTETTGTSGLATFNVNICNSLTAASVSSSADNVISFEIKPKSDVSTAKETLSLKADAAGKIDTADLIDKIEVTVDNFTETWVKFKIQANNGASGKKVYLSVNDSKILLDGSTNDNGTIYYTYYFSPSDNGEFIYTAEPFYKLKSFTANSVNISVVTGKAEVKKIVNTIDLSTSNLSIIANDNDSTLITIYATNNYGAVDGEDFLVSSNYGKVSANTVTIKNGFGQFSFKSPYYPNVKEATITVKDKNTSMSKTINISLKGLTLKTNSNKQFVKADGSDYAEIYISLKDASNNPVLNKLVNITTNDTNIILKNGSTALVFTNNKTTVNTDTNGEIHLTLSSNNAGSVLLTISSDTESSQLSFNFSGEEFLFKKDGNDIPSNLKLKVDTQHIFQFSWKDESGTGKTDKVALYTNLGTLSTYDGTKCGNEKKSSLDLNIISGTGSFCYYSNIIGNTIIQAVNDTENKSTSIEASVISDSAPAKIFVQASDSILSVSTDSVKNTSTITALVLDKDNHPLPDKQVIFTITENTGTGEKVYPIFATTDSTGRASTIFTSGSDSSALNGITVEAKVKDNEAVKGEVKLTVNDKAVNISIGKGIAIEDSQNATNYKKPFTVLVVDSNGSPVANQKVSLSLYVTKYRKNDNLTKNYYNEDINHNNVLDEGEDINGNGVLDPGPVATIPSEVTTNQDGFGVFYVEYPKCYAYWTDVRIIATTEVSGSEYGKGTELTLTYSIKDKDSMPCQSPFNNISSAK
jgi:adhesin/invasin